MHKILTTKEALWTIIASSKLISSAFAVLYGTQIITAQSRWIITPYTIATTGLSHKDTWLVGSDINGRLSVCDYEMAPTTHDTFFTYIYKNNGAIVLMSTSSK